MTDSWWVKNARDLEWTSNEMGEYCLLAADELAINLNVLGPGRPMALYRTERGRPVALADACWHRLAPLSMGKLVGADEIQCPYHGLRYNPSGRCTRLPAQETLNPSASVPSFPVVERHRYVWVWPGDPTLADPAAIPDMHQLDDPGWAGDGLTIEARCNYQLILDNLMDLTHEEFVHGSTLGQEELSQSEFSTKLVSDNHVTVTRWMVDVAPPPFWAKNIRDRFPCREVTSAA